MFDFFTSRAYKVALLLPLGHYLKHVGEAVFYNASCSVFSHKKQLNGSLALTRLDPWNWITWSISENFCMLFSNFKGACLHLIKEATNRKCLK